MMGHHSSKARGDLGATAQISLPAFGVVFYLGVWVDFWLGFLDLDASSSASLGAQQGSSVGTGASDRDGESEGSWRAVACSWPAGRLICEDGLTMGGTRHVGRP